MTFRLPLPTLPRDLAVVGLLLLPSGPAAAGAVECQQCCKDAGLFGCPTSLRVFGPGSSVSKEVGGQRVNGIWRLDCEQGARFEEGGTVVVASAPKDGDVLLVGSPVSTVECFRDWCTLPQGACLQPRPGGSMALVRCTDAQPLSEAQLLRPGVQASQTQGTTSTSTTLQAPTPSTPTPTISTVIIEPAEGSAYGPHLPAEGPLPLTLGFDLPPAPGARCVSVPALATESTRLVDQGDQARLNDQHREAADLYRAAVTVDRCNAIAWTALGQLALAADDLPIATTALRHATQLRPTHYGAQTSLGLAYEAQGELALAREAWLRALESRPGHPAAEDGLRRVGR